ncbi:hypothetical protein BASA83_011531 [Batrachochytrium salamandrivorans]|nr:hypothetical protein BASA62_009154 [Batrachochytrium salamandrivorans]KAH9264940.1 hypothetical protein BASA83_011531 [Batrachochytrium salamandrivorans]
MAPHLRVRKAETTVGIKHASSSSPTRTTAVHPIAEKSTGASKKLPSTTMDFVAIHKSVVADISKMGHKVGTHLPGRTFAAVSKVAKKQQVSSAVRARIVKSITKDVDTRDVNAHKAVTTQVKGRAVVNQIKNMGGKPMSLLTTNSVKTGVDVGFVTSKQHRRTGPSVVISGRVSKKSTAKTGDASALSPTTVMRTKVAKTVAAEIRKLGKGKLPAPSVVHARARISPAKIAVNTEILKRAAVKEIKRSRKPISPIRSPTKKSMHPKSPMKSNGSPRSKTH